MPDEPAITIPFIQARNYTPGPRRGGVDWIVIHTMEAPEKGATAENIASWFAGATAPKASAHYCIDNNSIVQCVRECDVAWHAPGANGRGIGLEHAGYAKQTAKDWADDYSMAMLKLSAKLCALICARYEIPVIKLDAMELKAGARGLCGHIDVTNAFNGGKGHWDPGGGFPWEMYLSLINGALLFPSTIIQDEAVISG